MLPQDRHCLMCSFQFQYYVAPTLHLLLVSSIHWCRALSIVSSKFAGILGCSVDVSIKSFGFVESIHSCWLSLVGRSSQTSSSTCNVPKVCSRHLCRVLFVGSSKSLGELSEMYGFLGTLESFSLFFGSSRFVESCSDSSAILESCAGLCPNS